MFSFFISKMKNLSIFGSGFIPWVLNLIQPSPSHKINVSLNEMSLLTYCYISLVKVIFFKLMSVKSSLLMYDAVRFGTSFFQGLSQSSVFSFRVGFGK